MPSFDTILADTCGGGGRWQWVLFAVAGLNAFIGGIPMFGAIFLTHVPDRWCPTPPTNWTIWNNETRSDKSICDESILLSTMQSVYMAAMLVGNIVFTLAADRFGRRPPMLVALALFILAGISTAFSPSLTVFLVFRFVTSMSGTGVFITLYVIVAEVSGAAKRTMFGTWIQLFFAMANMTMPLIALLVPDWSLLQLTTATPSLLLIVIYWLIPESPRWLSTKGRFTEALQVLRIGAKINKKTMGYEEDVLHTLEAFKKMEEVSEESQTCFLLGLCSSMRMTFVLCFTWFTVGIIYFGLSLKAPAFGSSIYWMVFLSGAAEVPAYLLSFVLVRLIGCRRTYCFAFIGGGVLCLCVLFVPEDPTWVAPIFILMSKFCITVCFAVSYLYTADLYRTSVRAAAIGCGNTCARIGSIVAPFSIDLMDSYGTIVSVAVFGFLSILSGVSICWLPDVNTRKESFHRQTEVT